MLVTTTGVSKMPPAVSGGSITPSSSSVPCSSSPVAVALVVAKNSPSTVAPMKRFVLSPFDAPAVPLQSPKSLSAEVMTTE